MNQYLDRTIGYSKRPREGSCDQCSVWRECVESDTENSWNHCIVSEPFTLLKRDNSRSYTNFPHSQFDAHAQPPSQNLSTQLNRSPDYILLPQTKPFSSNVRVEKALKKSSLDNPWVDIFASMKLLLFMRLPESDAILDSELQMNIMTADRNFQENFMFSDNAIKKSSFESLIGPGTCLDTVNKLKRSMRYGASTGEFINLYRRDHVPLCCFTSLRIFSGCHSENEGYVMSVMTINSSSVVGNMTLTGFGLLPNHPISKEGKAIILQEAVAKSTKKGV